MEEMCRLRLAYHIPTGTPVEAPACFRARVEACEPNVDCKEGRVLKSNLSAVSKAEKYYPIKSCVSPGIPSAEKDMVFGSTSWTLGDFCTVYWH